MSTEPGGSPALPDADALYEHAACGQLLTDRHGHILRANHTLCAWLGHAPDELVGRRTLQSLDLQHRAGHVLPVVMNALRTERAGVVHHHLALFIAQDRHQYERELLAARRRAEDLLAAEREAQRVLALTQARLRLALEAARLYLWEMDATAPEPRYEDKVALLLGHPAPQPISRQALLQCMHPDDRAAEAAALAHALDAADGVYRAGFRLRGIDGVLRSVTGSGRAFFDERPGLVQLVGVLNDVTELSQRRAQAEDRALFAEQMVGIVSHDLKTPLMAVRMSASLLGRSPLTPNQQRIVDRIGSATARANRLIGDLLDFTQARLGQGLQVSRRPLDLHALVADSVEELALSYPTHALLHVREGDGDCRADGDRLSQVIGNLVANAASHGAAAQPITVHSRIGAGGFELAVHNHGQAIAAEALQRIFEPMQRGTDAAAGGRSVGLGLYIVREIARAHGGSVTVRSGAGQGTTFMLQVPHA